MISAAARASWLVPISVLALIAFHERLPRSLPPLMLAAAAAAAVIGVLLGAAALGVAQRAPAFRPSVRVNALFGALASASVLVVVAVADSCGAAAMAEAQRKLEGTTAAALRDSPGWNGGATLGTTSLVASSLDRRSQASKVMTHPFDRALRVLVVSVDNRAGDHDVVVDLASVRLRLAGGGERSNLTRDELLAHHTRGADASGLVVGPFRVPAGARLDGIQTFFAEDVTFRDVEVVELRVDGAPLALQGRYFTLEEKRSIDKARVN